jgi:hypothetical protein
MAKRFTINQTFHEREKDEPVELRGFWLIKELFVFYIIPFDPFGFAQPAFAKATASQKGQAKASAKEEG